MKKNGGGADGSFGPLLGKRVVWDTDGPDHECDCPGPPPPRFYLPPPPRPAFLVDSECSKNSVSRSETCEALPVIDAEYHYSPAIPSLAIIVTVSAVVVVFLLIGTFLVLLKRRKMQNLLPRKRSPQNRSDAASANGVIYEDLTNVRPRTLSPHCPPGQTTLPPIEMIDVASYSEHTMFTPVFICSNSPVQDSYNTQELFNPVYEELSNGSGERGETDSEGIPQAGTSEDEFAEDELSLGGEGEGDREGDLRLRKGEVVGQDACRDVDSSDADDRCKFLGKSGRYSSQPLSDHRERGRRGVFRGPTKKAKSLDRRKIWRNKPLPPPPVDCNEFHEGFLLKRIMQIYPDVTGVGLQYSQGGQRSEPGQNPRRPKPEIFSTFGAMQSSGKTQSQDSDSGYSNNTSGGGKVRKEFGFPNHSNPVLS